MGSTLRRSLLLLAPAAALCAAAGPAAPATAAPDRGGGQLVQAEPPPFSEGIFPCSSCHKDLPRNAERRELAFHDEQQSVLSHGADRWCLDCHDLQDRDRLHLSNGTQVPFEQSFLL